MGPLLLLTALALQDDLPSRVRAWLESPKPDPAIAARLASHPLPELESAIRAVRPPPSEPGLIRGEADNPYDPGVKAAYELLVPEHDPAQLHPLVVSLHGQSGRGSHMIDVWRRHLAPEKGVFLLAPDAGRGGWGRSMPGFGNVLGPLADVLARYPIDPDRIHLGGGSMGGHGCFHLATRFPDRFASLHPRIGGPEILRERDGRLRPLFLENVANLPLYWVVGEKDEMCPVEPYRTARDLLEKMGAPVTFREIPGGGHEWFDQETPGAVAWMRDLRRDPYPKRVRYETAEKRFDRSGWVQVLKFSPSAEPRAKFRYVDLEGKAIEERTHFLHNASFRAECDREKNEIRIEAVHVEKVRLWLHDRMLDLDKPVTIRRPGRDKVVTPKRRAEALLESARRDRGMLFTATVEVEVKD